MKRPPDGPADLRCACAAARQAARILTQLYDRKLRGADVEAPQFAMLMTLDRLGPCSQADLGRRYALDKTTMSRNLKLLQGRGWIEAASSSDRRQRRFGLTDAGRKRLREAKPLWNKAQSQLRQALSGEQWEEMFRMFQKVAVAARNMQDG
jgi:DNA-binding MarR family transcriptional regulator